jgi:asparagine synthase (glutamine-hydrolysing)
MCGIFGLIKPGTFDVEELASASASIRHRGPDDEGFVLLKKGCSPIVFGGQDTPESAMANRGIPWAPKERLQGRGKIGSGGVAMVHRRLSIIDTSGLGHQPMCDPSARLWIAYNGEIFNYLELRAELECLGHRFLTETDTEVILAAYRQWGSACLGRFNGMWAFAICDLERNEIFFARDRFGVKPLYFWRNGSLVAFASEIKAFTVLDGWRARADRQGVLDCLVWSVMDHRKSTMFDGVIHLPPGHHLKIDLDVTTSETEQRDLQSVRWYRLPEPDRRPSGPEAVSGLRELLRDSVRLRLRADVPVGSCLSGGLDSSSIVSLMGSLRHEGSGQAAPLHTFTARSLDEGYDEFRYAEAVATRWRTEIHTVTPEPKSLFSELDSLVWHQDEPFLSTSIYAQWCVFRAARANGVTVMLDGQGADEALGGYRGYIGAYLAGLVRRGQFVPWWRELSALKREIGFGTFRSLGYTGAYLLPGIVQWAGRLDGRSHADAAWLAPEAREALRHDPIAAAGGRPQTVVELSRSQITATHLPMLLHWEDRNSMAHSIEARVPFLDYRVVEYCLSIDDFDKVGGGIPKKVLRTAMRGVVPDLVLDRRDKMGFVTAESLWARRDEPARFRAELAQAVDTLPHVLSPTLLSQFDEVLDGRRPFDQRYWRAICVSTWARRFAVRS